MARADDARNALRPTARRTMPRIRMTIPSAWASRSERYAASPAKRPRSSGWGGSPGCESPYRRRRGERASHGRASVHLRDQHVGLARRAEPPARDDDRPRRRAGGASGTLIAALGFDAVWLMGVWERSPAGVAIALADDGARRELPRGAAGLSPPRTSSARRTASATTSSTGTSAARQGLASAREALAERGLGADPRLRAEPRRARPPVDVGAPGVLRRRERRRPRARPGVVRARRRPGARERPRPVLPRVARRRAAERVLARRCAAAVVDTLGRIAEQCDGVRCDMAMLMMNDVFERTWGERAGPRPADDYWPTVIPRRQEPSPRLRLHRRGLLGPRVGAAAAGLRLLLRQAALRPARARGRRRGARAPAAPTSRYQTRLVRFIENHDEPRAARDVPARARRARPRSRRSTQTGARLVHEGQLEGRHGAAARSSSAAAPTSRPTPTCARSTSGCSAALRDPRLPRRRVAARRALRGWDGQRQLAEPRRLGLARRRAAQARRRQPRRRARRRARLAAVGRPARPDLAARRRLDRRRRYERSGDDLRDGLYVALDPWAWHLFDLTHADRRTDRMPTPRPPSTPASPRRRAAPRTTSSPRTRGTSGARTSASAPGAPCARTTRPTATRGARSRTTTPARAPTAGTRTGWPGSPTSATSSASRSRSGTATTRSSRSGCSG